MLGHSLSAIIPGRSFGKYGFCGYRTSAAGICWDFFFTAGDIYVDSKAGEKIKAQAQSLRFIVSNGIGLIFASTLCGQIFNRTVTATGTESLPQWQSFWLYPMAIAAAVAIVFLAVFKNEPKVQPANTVAKQDAA